MYYFSFRHEWAIQGEDALFVKTVRMNLNGTSIDGFDTKSTTKDIYMEFFLRYQLFCGDMMAQKADGMTIAEFDDNSFIVPFDLSNNANSNLSAELVPAVRTGVLQLEVEFSKMNTIPGLMVMLFGEFSAQMQITKEKNVEVSYTSKNPSKKL